MALILVIFDLSAIVLQATAFCANFLSIEMGIVGKTSVGSIFGDVSTGEWLLPFSIALLSLSYWENFVKHDSIFPFIRCMAKLRQNLPKSRSKVYTVVSVWKISLYLSAMFLFTSTRMPLKDFLAPEPFGAKAIKVTVWRSSDKVSDADLKFTLNKDILNISTDVDRLFDVETRKGYSTPSYSNQKRTSRRPLIIDLKRVIGVNSTTKSPKRLKRHQNDNNNNPKEDRVVKIFYTTPFDALKLSIFQIFTTFLCYQSAKFACKIKLQQISFALPIVLSTPATVIFLLLVCQSRQANKCLLTDYLPYELFWQCSKEFSGGIGSFLLSPQSYLWLMWFISELWVTCYIWCPKCERLASAHR